MQKVGYSYEHYFEYLFTHAFKYLRMNHKNRVWNFAKGSVLF